MMKNILSIENLNFVYPGTSRLILNNISLEIEKADILTILGANGSGKSTLLNCILKLNTPTKGVISLKGKDLFELSFEDIAKVIGFVHQESARPFDFNVRDYIVMGRAPYISHFKVPSKKDYELVDEIMDKLDIANLSKKSLLKISGGERQMAQIARALIQKPEILVFDEPTNHLDYGNQVMILNLIKDLSQKDHMTIITTTHMPDHAMLMNQKSAIIDGQGNLTMGMTRDILTAEKLEEIYGVDVDIVHLKKYDQMICLSKRK